jgi:AcrR family transcriptional regulator
MSQQRVGRAVVGAAKSRYGGVPLAERRALRRERLIAAAADVYGEMGYRNATVRSICQRANLTER